MRERCVLCLLSDLEDPGSLGVVVADKDGGRSGLMVVRRGDMVRAYVNRCPHVGTPLDFTPGRFWDSSFRYLLCASHGALFEPDTGECVFGPCAGKYLESFPVSVENGRVVTYQGGIARV